MREDASATRKQLIGLLVNELPVLRAKASVSQAERADKIGISRQIYNALETGKKEMDWTLFVALMAVFLHDEDTSRMLNSLDGFKESVFKEIDLY